MKAINGIMVLLIAVLAVSAVDLWVERSGAQETNDDCVYDISVNLLCEITSHSCAECISAEVTCLTDYALFAYASEEDPFYIANYVGKEDGWARVIQFYPDAVCYAIRPCNTRHSSDYKRCVDLHCEDDPFDPKARCDWCSMTGSWTLYKDTYVDWEDCDE